MACCRATCYASDCRYSAGVLGPIKWMAPEALRRRLFSEKTDAFAFGVCLWEMATGRMPWAGLSTVWKGRDGMAQLGMHYDDGTRHTRHTAHGTHVAAGRRSLTGHTVPLASIAHVLSLTAGLSNLDAVVRVCNGERMPLPLPPTQGTEVSALPIQSASASSAAPAATPSAWADDERTAAASPPAAAPPSIAFTLGGVADGRNDSQSVAARLQSRAPMDALCALMDRCWRHRATERPTMQECLAMLEGMHGHLARNAAFQQHQRRQQQQRAAAVAARAAGPVVYYALHHAAAGTALPYDNLRPQDLNAEHSGSTVRLDQPPLPSPQTSLPPRQQPQPPQPPPRQSRSQQEDWRGASATPSHAELVRSSGL